MARARNIKPGFFKNENLVDLDPFDRLLFIGLWCLADREGRIENRPKRIKMELFACDNYNVADGIKSLEAAGFVRCYVACEISVIEVCNFAKHQAPHGTEKDSELPNDNGFLTVNTRSKNGCVTGESRLVKCGTTLNNVNPPLDNTLNPDSLNPDSLNPEIKHTSLQDVLPKDSQQSAVREKKSARFPDFWAVWPKSDRKAAKAKCEDRWRKQGLDQCADEIIAHVTACKLSRSWLDGYEPAPLRYLTERRWADGTDLTVAEYSEDELDVFSRYNLTLANAGWPEACADVYSSDRSAAIVAFLGLGKKENWIDLYFDWLRESLEPRPGCGFDWVIRKDTFIRAREGNFSALKEAA